MEAKTATIVAVAMPKTEVEAALWKVLLLRLVM